MPETFLEEQLRRIRDMTEQIARVRAIHDTMHSRGDTSSRADQDDDESDDVRQPEPRSSRSRRR
jgi:hypothetical protein